MNTITSTWWKKVGIWQLLTVFVTLATLFVAFYVTDNKETSVIAATAAVAVIFISPVAVLATVTMAFAAALGTVFSAVFAAVAIFFSFSALTTGVSVLAALAVVVLAVGAAIAVSDEMAEYGVSKKAILLSYVAQFFLIFSSIFLFLR